GADLRQTAGGVRGRELSPNGAYAVAGRTLTASVAKRQRNAQPYLRRPRRIAPRLIRHCVRCLAARRRGRAPRPNGFSALRGNGAPRRAAAKSTPPPFPNPR